jgi:hypothetical protein
MGVYIDYSFYAECPEPELLARLRRLRRKVAKLPLTRVGKIQRLDPVYRDLPLHFLRKQGYRLPAAVRARIKGKRSLSYREACLLAAPPASMLVPKKLERRFMRPALDLLKTTELWNEAELPEKVEAGSLTIFRPGFAFEFANVMLRYGYLMVLDPGEGCETVAIGLTTLRNEGVPMWLGSGFTKTQYAAHFIQAHETICRVLDAAKEVGLLYRARDTCGFYRHRDWKQAAPIVNAETTFAHVIGSLLSAGVQAARAEGIRIEDVSDPATKNYNLIRVDDERAPKR